MISGRGSNLESLISSIKTHAWPIEIVLVVSDNPKAPGLRFAEWEEIPVAVVERGAMKRPAYDHALAEAIARLDDDRELARHLGNAARKKALTEYDERIIVARTLAVYDELFNDRATGKALANA